MDREILRLWETLVDRVRPHSGVTKNGLFEGIHDYPELLRSAYLDCLSPLLKVLPAMLAEIKRLHDYDTRLSAVMPPDFKDWHQNSPREWPEIAAWVIQHRRKCEEIAWEEVGRLRTALEHVLRDDHVPDCSAWKCTPPLPPSGGHECSCPIKWARAALREKPPTSS